MKCSTPCPAERPLDIHRKAVPKDYKDLTTASRVSPASRGRRQAPVWANQVWASKAWANQAWVSKAWVSKAWANQAWVSKAWASKAWASKAWASQAWASKAWEWARQACQDPVRAWVRGDSSTVIKGTSTVNRQVSLAGRSTLGPSKCMTLDHHM